MGIILMLLASASFATMAAILKGIGPDIPITQLVFLRSALSAPVLFVFIYAQGRPALVKAKKLLIWRTLFGVTAMHGFFYALTHMPLADCIFIGRSQPLMIALLAPWVLGEKTPRAAWVAILTGLVGVILIMNPALGWPLPAWVALAAAASATGAHLLLRRLNRTDYPLVIVFNFLLLSGLITAFWAVPNFVPLSKWQWLMIVGVAIFATLGQILMTSAYRCDKAPAVAAASYSSVILSVIYGYLFWGEVPHPLAWLGGVFIIGGGLLLVKSRYKINEEKEFMEATGIDCRNDRMARDIRNSLAKAFVAGLGSGDLAETRRLAATWLTKSSSSIYRKYIQRRLESYEKALAIIRGEQVDQVFYRALVLWDLGLFFEVHEILEPAWLTAIGADKQILQAMIRAAGVYIHLENGNLPGAEKMAAKSRQTLLALRQEIPPFAGLDLLLSKLASLDSKAPIIYS